MNIKWKKFTKEEFNNMAVGKLYRVKTAFGETHLICVEEDEKGCIKLVTNTSDPLAIDVSKISEYQDIFEMND